MLQRLAVDVRALWTHISRSSSWALFAEAAAEGGDLTLPSRTDRVETITLPLITPGSEDFISPFANAFAIHESSEVGLDDTWTAHWMLILLLALGNDVRITAVATSRPLCSVC